MSQVGLKFPASDGIMRDIETQCQLCLAHSDSVMLASPPASNANGPVALPTFGEATTLVSLWLEV